MITRDSLFSALRQALAKPNSGARRPAAVKATTGVVNGGGRRPFVGAGGPRKPSGGGCACSGARK
jgi:hypothetical protein